jgi:hypothetical protein
VVYVILFSEVVNSESASAGQLFPNIALVTRIWLLDLLAKQAFWNMRILFKGNREILQRFFISNTSVKLVFINLASVRTLMSQKSSTMASPLTV